MEKALVKFSDLPSSNAVHPLTKGSLMHGAEFECVSPDLDQIVGQCAQAGQGIGRGEQGDVAELDEHLQEVFESALVLNHFG